MDKERPATEGIEFSIATVDDAAGIREVQFASWMATYVNAEYGITRDDITAHTTARREERIKSAAERLGKADGEPCFIAKDNGRVVGFGWPQKSDEHGTARVGSLYILPEYQGRGIGGELLKRELEWFGNDKDIYLEITRFNDKARIFYQRFGFAEVGPGDDFKLNNGKVMPTTLLMKSKA